MTPRFASISGFVFALAVGLQGCALVRPEKAEPPRRFVLEVPTAPAPASAGDGPVLLVALPAARPGYDSPRMVYVTRAHEIEAFARSEWVDSPARMLAPLLVSALAGSVRPVLAPGPVAAALRLDTEVVALHHDFTQTPSQVRFALRAQLIDTASRTLLATTELEAVEASASEDPYGGVIAANRAVARVLGDLAGWVRESVPR